MVFGYWLVVQMMYEEIASDKQGLVRLNPGFVNEYCYNNTNDTNEIDRDAYISYKEHYAHLVEDVWWPGCGYGPVTANGSVCGEPCYSASFMKEMLTFNEANPGKLVTYKSRPDKLATVTGKFVEQVKLRGWWLPPVRPTGDDKLYPQKWSEHAPRIVLQHGTTSNGNKYRQIAAAYMLRKLGFGVLVNNLRDHCYSDRSTDNSSDLVHWGHSYPLDLLGAWDYARNDPDHELGGAIDKSKVGLFGFSMGAFTTSTAFGLETQVPAAWADGGPFSPRTVTFAAVKMMAKPFHMDGAIGFVEDHVWSKVQAEMDHGGVDIAKTNPKKTLQLGSDTHRPYFIVHNIKDATSPYSEHELLMEHLGGLKRKYNYENWTTNGECHDTSHCADHVSDFDTYLQKACTFWYPVFKIADKNHASTVCSNLFPQKLNVMSGPITS